MCLYSSQRTRVYVAIYGNTLIVHKLFKLVHVSTDICLCTYIMTFMYLYSSQRTRVYVAIYGNMLIVYKLFKFVHVSTNICLYTHILTYIYLYSPNSVLECMLPYMAISV